MYLSSRLLILVLVICGTNIDTGYTKTRIRGQHIFTLLGYLHGYKIGQKFTVHLPTIMPVIVMPLINQQQTVSIEKFAGDQSYQGSDIDVNTLASKLESNTTYEKEKKTEDNNTKIFQEDHKINNLNDDELQGTKNVFRQAVVNIIENNIAIAKEQTATISSVGLEDTHDIAMQESNATASTEGSYPNAAYNNEIINSLMLTVYLESNYALPPIIDDRWQNFSLKLNTTGNHNISLSTAVDVTSTELFTQVPYSAASSHNKALIDQVSVTTNSYTKNELAFPSEQDDRWSRFSSFKYSNAGEFKPLAGLYYDGYLHTPIKKEHFSPYINHVYDSEINK